MEYHVDRVEYPGGGCFHGLVFESIPASDTQKLVDFVNRRQPDWKLPLMQIILDWVAGLTLILETCAVCIFLARKWLLRDIFRFPSSFLRRLTGRR